MEYYAVVKHHSVTGCWSLITATSLVSAKRQATKEFGKGYYGHIINLVEVPDGNDFAIGQGLLNDLPAHTKVIGSCTGWQFSR